MPLDSVREVVTLGASLFSLVMLIASIRKMRQEMYVPASAPIIAIAVTSLAVCIYLALTNTQVNWSLAALVLGAGFFIGLLEGQLTRLYYRGPIIYGKRSTAYLVLWGLAYLLTLLLSQLGSALLQAVGVLVLVFGLGMALGDNINLLVRQATLRRPKADSASLVVSPVAPPAGPVRTSTHNAPPPPPPANIVPRQSRGCGLAVGCLIGLAILIVIFVVVVVFVLAAYVQIGPQ